jgi:hypothetical protein
VENQWFPEEFPSSTNGGFSTSMEQFTGGKTIKPWISLSQLAISV